jgi:two-component system, LuxR family, response regulator FixJ
MLNTSKPGSWARKRASTIAILDDDAEVRDSLVALMEAYGFNVSNHASAGDFLGRHCAQAVDCLLLDVHMPEVTGLELLKSLRDRGDATAVILMTGVFDPNIHANGEALGAAAVLHKPIAHSELMAAIHQALAAKKP